MKQPAKNSDGLPIQAPAAAKGWVSLTWDDLDQWAGSRSVSRGQAYQREGRVKDLAISGDGRLLATVIGGDRYVVSVWRPAKGTGAGPIESRCTCPVGYNGCKHAVAVVAAFLQSLADQVSVPIATDGDSRWAELVGDDADLEEDEDFDDEPEDEGEEAERPKPSKRRTSAEWEEKIQRHIREKDHDELADLVWSLVRRFPELRGEFRERIALSEGDVERLVAQARRELREVTAEVGWSNSWNDEGNTPDYSRLRHRLERLIELGHCDAVVTLGRELISCGIQQVEESHDEGETAAALAECLPVVFDAVAKSPLSGPQKLLFAIDAHLTDDYDIIGDAADPILNAPWQPADWSAVADALAERLKRPVSATDDRFARNYQRDQISNWLLEALKNAGRDGEQLAIYEAEARATGSYERLVSYLIAQRRFEDAQRWALEGIDKTYEKLPGIASSLAKALCEMARHRKHWPVVAAHAAFEFFEHPSPTGFKELVKVAGQAGCEEKVRAAAIGFLETDACPIRLAASGKEQRKVRVEPDWPLPVPEYLVPLMRTPDAPGRTPPRPHYSVLLEMAIADQRADDVLHWYDKMRADRESATVYWNRYADSSYAERVADAVAKSRPERALEIHQEMLGQQLKHAHISAYESAAATLRKMRPILKALGRESEWKQLLADIRLKHRNRPRFMEILDRLEGGTILESQTAPARRTR